MVVYYGGLPQSPELRVLQASWLCPVGPWEILTLRRYCSYNMPLPNSPYCYRQPLALLFIAVLKHTTLVVSFSLSSLPAVPLQLIP